MNRITRRRFLAGSAATSAALMFASSRVLGANEEIRAAVVGLNGRGGSLLNDLRRIAGVRVAAVCDADQAVLDKTTASLSKANVKVAAYQDVRKLYEDKNIDVVAIASPNHWHSLMTVWACQAGKDVYCEKPVSHNIFEGRKCHEAALKYNRVVQTGTQRRSDRSFQNLFKFIQAGNLGKILYARGFCYKRRASIGKTEGPQPVPPTLDYNLWCGPSPMIPLRRKNLHYDWHWVWETGNGDIGNQGIHEMDLCRWALGEQELAPRVYSFGGRFGYDDDATTPNTLVSIFDYKTAPLIFEVRGLPMKTGSNTMDNYRGVRIGVVIQCEGGYYAGGEGGGWVYDKDGKRMKQYPQDGPGEHMANFIKAVRSRKPEDNVAPILGGHISSALCHMGNCSYRVGKEMAYGQLMERVKAGKEDMDSLERMKAHLAANDVDVEKTLATMGPVLAMDPKSERFTGEFSAEANKYVSRDYRAPFVVPEQV